MKVKYEDVSKVSPDGYITFAGMRELIIESNGIPLGTDNKFIDDIVLKSLSIHNIIIGKDGILQQHGKKLKLEDLK